MSTGETYRVRMSGISKRYGAIQTLDRRVPDAEAGRGPGPGRRQCRRQVDADQGAVGGGTFRMRARSRSTASRSSSLARPMRGGARRDGLSGPIALRHGRRRRQLFLGREPRRRIAGISFLDKPRMREQARADAGPPRHRHPDTQAQGRKAFRRPAAVDRDRPRRLLRAARADHGRADRGAGRRRGRGGAGADPHRRARAASASS